MARLPLDIIAAEIEAAAPIEPTAHEVGEHRDCDPIICVPAAYQSWNDQLDDAEYERAYLWKMHDKYGWPAPTC